MIEPILVYKVVRKSGNDFISLSAPKNASVIYRVGEYTSAPEWLASSGYSLMAFRSEADVQSFFRDSLTLKSLPPAELHIFKADALGWTNSLPIRLADIPLGDKIIVPNPITKTWPAGTVMANKIRLKQDVTNMLL